MKKDHFKLLPQTLHVRPCTHSVPTFRKQGAVPPCRIEAAIRFPAYRNSLSANAAVEAVGTPVANNLPLISLRTSEKNIGNHCHLLSITEQTLDNMESIC